MTGRLITKLEVQVSEQIRGGRSTEWENFLPVRRTDL